MFMMIPANRIHYRLLAEAPRLCRDCAQLSHGGRCLASRLVDAGLPSEFFPKVSESRFCSGFEPYPGSPDDRTGSELWPGLDLLADAPSVGDAVTSAALYLTDALARGERLASAILSAGEDRGLHRRGIQRASVLLGVRKRRTRFGGHWIWYLPACYGDKA